MNRSAGMMAMCLALGAAFMYASANLRVRVDVADTEAAAQPAPSRPDGFATLPLPPVRQAAAWNDPVPVPPPPATSKLDAPTIDVLTLADTKKKITKADDLSTRDVPAYRANATALGPINVTPPKDAKTVYLEANGKVFPLAAPADGKAVSFTGIDLGINGLHTLRAYGGNDTVKQGSIAQVQVYVRQKGPTIEGISAPGFGTGKNLETIEVRFTNGSQLKRDSLLLGGNFVLSGLNGLPSPRPAGVEYDSLSDTLRLTFSEVKPGAFTFALPATGKIEDLFGNPLETVANMPPEVFFTTTLYTQTLEQLPLPTPGVALQHGPYVPMYEYQTRPPSPAGFNPSDKVDSRVVRLYYYRDAHRVAMIVNRSVKSYAAASVEVRQRSAERSRDDVERHTIERKRLGMIAVRSAQEARAAESQLEAARSRAAAGLAESAQANKQLETKQLELEQAKRALAATPDSMVLAERVKALELEVQTLKRVASIGDAAAANGQADVARLQQQAQALRDAEVKATEAWQVKELEETRMRKDEFRLDVAAATADPITYAPGKPDSYDPVQQVSLSVIGEGLIQLRGPMKGINIIRVMINQIDAPVGQVRIAMHTVQVNGERGNRMEKVVANIQRYIDHSRFLTATSSQMLKDAVTVVAARRAESAAAELGPLCTQEARDRKYLHAFFGKDFIDELVLLDSEFLKTGNKLLSLHSMDTTSLSAALFMMALAKNDVRREILAEFQARIQGELPTAEWNYYLSGLTPEKCDACCDKKHYMLAQNAKFQSFTGFFNVEIAGPDTMTPLQREFIRLAQIFKAHLVTEITLKQRVLERSLVEERIGGDYREELRKAKEAEDAARRELLNVQLELPATIRDCRKAVGELQAVLSSIENQLQGVDDVFQTIEGNKKNVGMAPLGNDPRPLQPLPEWKHTQGEKGPRLTLTFSNTPFYRDQLLASLKQLSQFNYLDDGYKQQFFEAKKLIEQATDPAGVGLTEEDFRKLRGLVQELKKLIQIEIQNTGAQLQAILSLLSPDAPDTARAMTRYFAFKNDVLRKLNVNSDIAKTARAAFAGSDAAFDRFSNYETALNKARLLRRPLDEKKLLDLLVDDTEDKFIEQLEGTRAHTANVDNYIKAITTALDDDLNTQFYQPAFRKVREASRLWDVTLGQIETTSVLTNNRSFAKVSPSATMEFDLPKRDIMITEGFKSAKALFDEYGALMNDQTFLALAKLYSGVPSTGQMGTGGNFSAVRNVIPGLPGSPDETIMAQGGPGRKEFGSALEALIPDPAVYKFETGTGYEVRPVLAPDGQAVVFNLQYLYTTDVREPVRADEKHLGRVKRHFVHTDVQLSNFELREVSKYMVALKTARTAKGVPLLQDVPGLGILFRPLPSAESSLQENLIYSQATIFPTLFDLMGLRYAQSIADLDPLATRMAEFAARYRELELMQRTAILGATRVDDAIRIPEGERRRDIYFPPTTIPHVHPNGATGNQRDSSLIEGPAHPYDVRQALPDTRYAPKQSWPSATKPLPPEAYLPPNPGTPPLPNLSAPALPGPPPSTPTLRPGETLVPGSVRVIPAVPPPSSGLPLGQPRPVVPGVPPPMGKY